jgi:PAS domain S-box-containing protein
MGMEPTDAARSLEERLRRLETAVSASGLGMFEWNVRTGDLTWNARNRELYGVTHDRPLKISEYNELIHPDDREVVAQAYRAARDLPEGGDFSMEYRTAYQPDGRTRWLQTRGRVLKDGSGPYMAVGSTLDITDRKMAEERRSLVLRELAHRAKNGILIMMAIVGQTARSATSVKHFEEVLTARLKSMADSQDLVTEAAGKPLPLRDLLERALTPFDTKRFDIDPQIRDVRIPTEAVVAMALLLHELSTNAVKYGALSAPAGRVRLDLASRADEGKTVLSWAETGGPEVKPATRRGFGSRLLEISLRNQGGHVEGQFDPTGFQARIHFPSAAA